MWWWESKSTVKQDINKFLSLKTTLQCLKNRVGWYKGEMRHERRCQRKIVTRSTWGASPLFPPYRTSSHFLHYRRLLCLTTDRQQLAVIHFFSLIWISRLLVSESKCLWRYILVLGWFFTNSKQRQDPIPVCSLIRLSLPFSFLVYRRDYQAMKK